MKDSLCIVLVILVFSTSLNQGQKIKSNERRAIGIFPYPRTGRHLAMASFTRADGNVGMVNYPRVGRSGSISFNDDRNSVRDFSLDPRIDSYRDFEPEISENFDYPGHHAVDYEESRKRLEALRNGNMWLGGQSTVGQAKEHHRMNRCNQQIDGPWAVLFATRDLANMDQQPVHNFVPRLVSEVDHEASPTNNIVS